MLNPTSPSKGDQPDFLFCSARNDKAEIENLVVREELTAWEKTSCMEGIGDSKWVTEMIYWFISTTMDESGNLAGDGQEAYAW